MICDLTDAQLKSRIALVEEMWQKATHTEDLKSLSGTLQALINERVRRDIDGPPPEPFSAAVVRVCKAIAAGGNPIYLGYSLARQGAFYVIHGRPGRYRTVRGALQVIKRSSQ